MAKKITTKVAMYDVNADVVISDSEGKVDIAKFSGEGSSTRSKRELSKTIRETYENDGYEVIAIRNLTTTKYYEIHSYSVEASNSEILEACRNAGITVNEIFDCGSEAEEAEEA